MPDPLTDLVDALEDAPPLIRPEPGAPPAGVEPVLKGETLLPPETESEKKYAKRLRRFQIDRVEGLSRVLDDTEGLDAIDQLRALGKWSSESQVEQETMREFGYKDPGLGETSVDAFRSFARNLMAQGVGEPIKAMPLYYKMIQGIFTETGDPAHETGIYKLGQRVVDTANEAFPEDPRLRNDFILRNLPEGFGSLVAFFTAGKIGGSAAGILSPLAKARKLQSLGMSVGMTGQGVAVQSLAHYEDALYHGASERKALQVSWWGVPEGLSELAGAGRILHNMDKATGGLFYKQFMTYLQKSALGGVEEGLQEFFQQETHEQVAVALYRNYRAEITESLKAGAIGGILGALLGGISAAPAVRDLQAREMADRLNREMTDSAAVFAAREGDISRPVFEQFVGYELGKTKPYGHSIEERNQFRDYIRAAQLDKLNLDVANASEVLDEGRRQAEAGRPGVSPAERARAAVKIVTPPQAVTGPKMIAGKGQRGAQIPSSETQIAEGVQPLDVDEVAPNEATAIESQEEFAPRSLEEQIEQKVKPRAAPPGAGMPAAPPTAEPAAPRAKFFSAEQQLAAESYKDLSGQSAEDLSADVGGLTADLKDAEKRKDTAAAKDIKRTRSRVRKVLALRKKYGDDAEINYDFVGREFDDGMLEVKVTAFGLELKESPTTKEIITEVISPTVRDKDGKLVKRADVIVSRVQMTPEEITKEIARQQERLEMATKQNNHGLIEEAEEKLTALNASLGALTAEPAAEEPAAEEAAALKPEEQAKVDKLLEWAEGRDDVVRDENGDPLIVWHGSQAYDPATHGKLTTGEVVRTGDPTMDTFGVFFTTDLTESVIYAQDWKGKGSGLTPALISTRGLKTFDYHDWTQFVVASAAKYNKFGVPIESKDAEGQLEEYANYPFENIKNEKTRQKAKDLAKAISEYEFADHIPAGVYQGINVEAFRQGEFLGKGVSTVKVIEGGKADPGFGEVKDADWYLAIHESGFTQAFEVLQTGRKHEPAAEEPAAPAATIPDEPTIQRDPDGQVTINVDEDRVAALENTGLSKDAALTRAAAEAISGAPVETTNQAQATVLGAQNKIVSLESLQESVQFFKRKGPTTLRTGAEFTPETIYHVGRVALFYAEAVPKLGWGELVKFIKAHFQGIPTSAINKILKHTHATGEDLKKYKDDNKNPYTWWNFARKLNKESREGVKRPKAVINEGIRWNEGDTVEVTAGKLLKWSMKRQVQAAAQAGRAQRAETKASISDLITIANQLPPAERGRVLPILRRAAGMKTSPEVRETLVKAVNHLVYMSEHARALKSFRAAVAQAKALNLRPEYQKKLEELLEGIRVQEKKPEIIKRMESLLSAVAKLREEEGEVSALQIPQRMIDRAIETLRQQDDLFSIVEAEFLSPDTLEILTKTIDSLMHNMLLKNKLLWSQRYEGLQEAAKATADGMRERRKHIRDLDNYDQVDDLHKPGVDVAALAYWDHLSMDTLAHILGGRESAAYEFFSHNLRRARDEMAAIQRASQQHIQDALKELGVTPRDLSNLSDIGGKGFFRSMLAKIGLSRGAEKVTVKLPTAKRWGENIQQSRVENWDLTRGQMISIYLHFHDPSTRESMLSDKGGGFVDPTKIRKKGVSIKFTKADFDAVIGAMTERDIAIAKAMSQFINGYLADRLNVEWLSTHGIHIAKQEGYYPRLRDHEALDKEGEVSPDLIMQDWLDVELDRMGIFKPRQTKVKAGVMLYDAFQVYYAHTNRAGAFIAKNRAITDAFKILNHADTQNALRETFKDPRNISKRIEYFLKSFRGLEVRQEQHTGFERILRAMLRNIHLYALSFKIWIGMYQTASLWTLSTEVSPRFIGGGILKSMSPTTRSEIKAWSAIVYQRLASGGHQIMTPGYTGDMGLEFYGGVPRDLAGRAHRVMDRTGMWLIKQMDAAVIATIWEAVKREQQAQGLDPANEAEFMQAVANRVVDIIDRTQPTWGVLTTSRWQVEGRHRAMLKLATMFSSQRNKNFNIVVKASSDFSTAENKVKAAPKLVRTLGTTLLGQSLQIYLLSDLMYVLTALAWGDEDDVKEWTELSLTTRSLEWLKRIMGNWLVMGDALTVAADLTILKEKGLSSGYARTRRTIPAQMIEDGWRSLLLFNQAFEEQMSDEIYERGMKQAGQRKHEDTYSRAIDKFLRAIGPVTGLPTSAYLQTFGRGFKFRKRKKWKHAPINRLQQLKRDHDAARTEASDIRVKLGRRDRPELRQRLVELKIEMNETRIAKELWGALESEVMPTLKEARRTRNLQETADAEMTVAAVADAYQEYVDTGSARGLIEINLEKWRADVVQHATKREPLHKIGVSKERKLELNRKWRENVALYRRIFSQMTKGEAKESALRMRLFGMDIMSLQKQARSRISKSDYAGQDVSQLEEDDLMNIIMDPRTRKLGIKNFIQSEIDVLTDEVP